MKCPNCGAEMKEGRLYCEQCGEDIHMVPDFEPELELNMEQSLEHVRKDVAVEDEYPIEDDTYYDFDDEEKLTGFAKWIRIISGVIIFAVILVLVIAGMRIYNDYSVDYQVAQANKAIEKGDYESAIAFYDRAIELDRRDMTLKLEQAEVYWKNHNAAKYEELLMSVVNDPITDAEQLQIAYGKLIAIYRAKGDYRTINDMLLACESDVIRSIYQGYLAQPPQFSIPAGNYDEEETLKLNVTGTGTIFYTLDGSLPDKNSEVYTAPILLEEGDHIIRAVYMNDSEVFSDIVSAEYHIEIDHLDAPEINVDSGDYAIPMFITVLNNSDDVYYTTDGTDPTLGSSRYTTPIPMPLGVSTFRFAKLEAGRTSPVVEKTYDLQLETEFSEDQAVQKILEYAIRSGKILDGSGHFDETAAYYSYQFQFMVRVNDINDFYVVAEVLSDAQGLSVKTGNYFAVNAYTGYYYKLLIDNGTYTLIDIQVDEPQPEATP